MLPVTNSGEPDYKYMAEYTKQKRLSLINKYRVHAQKRIADLGEIILKCQIIANGFFKVSVCRNLIIEIEESIISHEQRSTSCGNRSAVFYDR